MILKKIFIPSTKIQKHSRGVPLNHIFNYCFHRLNENSRLVFWSLHFWAWNKTFSPEGGSAKAVVVINTSGVPGVRMECPIWWRRSTPFDFLHCMLCLQSSSADSKYGLKVCLPDFRSKVVITVISKIRKFKPITHMEN